MKALKPRTLTILTIGARQRRTKRCSAHSRVDVIPSRTVETEGEIASECCEAPSGVLLQGCTTALEPTRRPFQMPSSIALDLAKGCYVTDERSVTGERHLCRSA
jgi:hypothetical protein